LQRCGPVTFPHKIASCSIRITSVSERSTIHGACFLQNGLHPLLAEAEATGRTYLSFAFRARLTGG